ncbi:methyltransferase domain-containing protein [Actinacidiphila acididurans]|uniref:methyltransferase domain-containing protein n=1 Tax=Actinacidiphila acididurans TaxID=2784346 RepID=UPI001F1603DD|nr:methyltransferase domain-containing protein [Actinacidiphila acididurans]
MLDALSADIGHTVFELGTGTGYNAALMSYRLGADRVTSVDVDPELVSLATRRLTEYGSLPHVTVGDGALGCPERAPFDRIIATAALRTIHPALLGQARVGTVIVAPIGFGIARVIVTAPHHASGRFLATPAFFMPRRRPGRTPDFETVREQDPESTSVPVSEVLDRLRFPLSLALPGFNSCTWRNNDGALTGIGLWTEDGSTVATHVNGHVRQTGPRRLWDTVENLSGLFPEAPRREDFGITITPDDQCVWYREPKGASWRLSPG